MGTEVLHLKSWQAYRLADVGRLLSPTELRNQSRDLKGIYPDYASGKRWFDPSSRQARYAR